MAKNLVKLAAPEGATSLHFNGNDYEVQKGFVEVPAEAVADLVGAHGYTVATGEAAAAQASAGHDNTVAKGNTPAAAPSAPSAPAWAPQSQQ